MVLFTSKKKMSNDRCLLGEGEFEIDLPIGEYIPYSLYEQYGLFNMFNVPQIWIRRAPTKRPMLIRRPA